MIGFPYESQSNDKTIKFPLLIIYTASEVWIAEHERDSRASSQMYIFSGL